MTDLFGQADILFTCLSVIDELIATRDRIINYQDPIAGPFDAWIREIDKVLPQRESDI